MLSVKLPGVGEEVLSILKCVGDFFLCVCASVQLPIQSDSSLHLLWLIPTQQHKSKVVIQKPRQKMKEEKTPESFMIDGKSFNTLAVTG